MIIKQFITIILLFSILSVSAQEEFKLISYNIWNGFDWGKDKEREEKLISWMASKAPDMVALQELCAYTDQRLKAQAKAWGHEYSVLLKTTGYSVGLTSKYPITVKEKIIDGMHHGALHCSSNGIEIFVIHLSPFKWAKRTEEAEILSTRIEREIQDGKNVIVCGDFNAFSPVDSDWYQARKRLLERSKEGDKKNDKVENLREETFDYSVLSKFYSLGLSDAGTGFIDSGNDRISFPSRVFAKNEEEQKKLVERGIRIDYILSSYNLVDNWINSQIFNGPEAYFLSDHYPVEAIFNLPKQ